MFDDIIKELNKVSNFTYSMPILSDKDGYMDKECKNKECGKKFKVFSQDWNALNKNSETYCPFCGEKANIENWYTTEQINQAKEQAKQKMYYEINNAFNNGIKVANNKLNNQFNKKSFVKINLSYKSSFGKIFINLPAKSLETMQQKITCPFCNFKYEVIGSAFFCPKCGKNSVIQTFDKTLEKIVSTIKNINVIKESVANKDEAQMIIDSLKENAIINIVTSFQVLCEYKYKELNPNQKIRKNVFQNLIEGSNLFDELINVKYTDFISNNEYNKLNVCFQKRHCLEHKNGIIDEDYIIKTKALKEKIGQRIVISSNEILDYISIVKKLCSKIINFKI